MSSWWAIPEMGKIIAGFGKKYRVAAFEIQI